MKSNNFVVLDADGNKVETLQAGEKVDLYCDVTPFYAEKGGQVGDTGDVWFGQLKDNVKVIDCNMRENLQRHVLLPEKDMDISKAEEITLKIDDKRRKQIMKHHTATHILHYALRQVLGKHVHQKGSLVSPDRLRFDFTHFQAMTYEEIIQVEKKVNELVNNNHKTSIKTLSLDDAKKKGAMALFGEKYTEEVRVVTVGPSIELCGGSHVNYSSRICMIYITQETSVAKGIRRIEAVAGMQAVDAFRIDRMRVKYVANKLNSPVEEIPIELPKLLDNQKAHKILFDMYFDTCVIFARKASEETKEEAINYISNRNEEREKEAEKSSIIGPDFQHDFENIRVFNLIQEIRLKKTEEYNVVNVKGTHVLVDKVPDANMKTLEKIADEFREKHNPSGVLLIGGDEKLFILAGCTKDAVKKGFHSGKLVKEIAEFLGGKGGGAPHFARGSGKDKIKVQEALKKAKEILQNEIK